MIIEEKLSETLVKHHSDKGVYIRQIETGIEYASAIDVIPCRYTYEETDKMIETNPYEITEAEYEAILEAQSNEHEVI